MQAIPRKGMTTCMAYSLRALNCSERYIENAPDGMGTPFMILSRFDIPAVWKPQEYIYKCTNAETAATRKTITLPYSAALQKEISFHAVQFHPENRGKWGTTTNHNYDHYTRYDIIRGTGTSGDYAQQIIYNDNPVEVGRSLLSR